MASSRTVDRSLEHRAGRVMLFAWLCMALLAGCASGKPEPANLVPVAAAESANVIRLSRQVHAALPADAAVTLPGASQWRRVGAIVQGMSIDPWADSSLSRRPEKPKPIWWSLQANWWGFICRANAAMSS